MDKTTIVREELNSPHKDRLLFENDLELIKVLIIIVNLRQTRKRKGLSLSSPGRVTSSEVSLPVPNTTTGEVKETTTE